MANAIQSSEGENIVMNLERLAARLGEFVENGEDPKEKKFNKLVNAIKEINEEDIVEIYSLLL